jgi:uncharacterized protein YndB with AHSA1/START domain
MGTKIDPAIPPELRDVTITRTFDAPRELVWQAWTEPKHIAAWWGPRGFSAPHPTADLRVGGNMNFDMRFPDGSVTPVMATIREIRPPERLVLSMVSMWGKDRTEMLNDITLAEANGKTKLTLRVILIEATVAMLEGLKGMRDGWGESLDKMAELLAGLKIAGRAHGVHEDFRAKSKSIERKVTHGTFVIERSFDAAPGLVFNAFADEKAKDKWFGGPPGWVTTEKSVDFRVGGREVNSGGPEGGPVSKFYATYYDIVPDTRLVYAYEMYLDDTRISVSVATIEFKPAGRGTRLVLTEQGAYLDGFDQPAAREEGTRYLMDQLARSLGERIVG